MKTLCKILLILIALSVLMVPNAMATAFPIEEGTLVTMTVANYPNSPYTMTNPDGDTFTTFCLEEYVYFTIGESYKVDSVEDYATGGGGGAADGKDPVSDETKWLYAAFMEELFTDANLVQKAIWYLENENDSYEDIWINNFLTAYDEDDDHDEFFGWDIKAVNLTDTGGNDIQSQLVGFAPVPEPATILLLGIGLIGMAGLGRKKLKG